VPAFVVLVLELTVLGLTMKLRRPPSLGCGKKLANCYRIGVVYGVYPVVVVGGSTDVEVVNFAAAYALDLGAKVCPFCCGGWVVVVLVVVVVVVVVSYKFDAFLGVIFCSPKFDRSVPVFGLRA
jgi:hypothetical protein